MHLKTKKFLLLTTSLGWFTIFSSRIILTPSLPSIISEFSIPYSMAGLLTTAILITYSLTQIPSGILSDRFGQIRLIVISFTMTATSLILIVTSSDYFHLFLSMLFLGFASGIYYPASVSLIAHNFEKRGKALSYNDLALNLGGIMLPIIAGFIILQWGWREIFLIPLILTLIVTSMFIYMRSYSKKVERTGEALFSITRPILLITFAYILINSFYWGVAVFLPTYARFLNFNVVLSSAIASIPFVGGFVGNLIFGNLSDTMGRKKVITMLFIFGAFFVFILSTGSRFLLFPVVLLFGVVTLPCFPIIFAYVSDIAPQDKMGSTLGFVNAIGSFIGSTSPFISGYIIDIAGFKYYVYFNAMLPILALLILRRIR